jgi:aminomethyltransferase
LPGNRRLTRTQRSLILSHIDLAARTTPLDALHHRLGGRMVPFAGWSLPVQYQGTLIEHKAARTSAALFDVSHMGQVSLPISAAAALERLVPGDILGLAAGRQRYTMFTNDQGGILDDIMVAHYGDRLVLVINAARAAADIAHMRATLPESMIHADRALLALQGPKAVEVMARLAPAAATLPFLGVAVLTLAGAECWVTRSGYTGEDGYEISVPADQAAHLAETLLAAPEVTPAGLAARDTLRLEAGLCLYGSDIDETTTPIEANLAWTIGKRRRREAGFPGAEVILRQLAEGPARLRVGLRPEGRAPARAHTEILDAAGAPAGMVTSGTFGPTLAAPVAMGYVRADLAADSTKLTLSIRGQHHPAHVAALPFIPHRFVR